MSQRRSSLVASNSNRNTLQWNFHVYKAVYLRWTVIHYWVVELFFLSLININYWFITIAKFSIHLPNVENHWCKLCFVMDVWLYVYITLIAMTRKRKFISLSRPIDPMKNQEHGITSPFSDIRANSNLMSTETSENIF